MKNIKTYTEFLHEDAVQAGDDSKVVIDDVILASGEEIKGAEILGVIIDSKTEKEFVSYFYDEYGNGAFTKEDIAVLSKSYNEYEEEKNAEEAEEEEAEEEGSGEDSTVDDIEELESEI